MATDKTILGHIDCPVCKTPGGMRITLDKNGEPFGFCEAECNQQLRVGGNARRVSLFVKHYPWAAKPAPSQAPAEKPAPSQAPAVKPAPKRSAFDMGL